MVEKSYGTCLLCIPLRIGIVLISIAAFANGFLAATVWATGDYRLQSGGYSVHTARLQAATGVAGLVFGVVGMLGVYDNKPDSVRNLARFLEAKLVVAGLVFVFDIVALMQCTAWANDPLNKALNTPLYRISSKNLCSTARLCYGIGFAIDFGLNYYCAWVTRVYTRRLASSQSYLIRFHESVENTSQVKLPEAVCGAPAQYMEGPTGAPPMSYGT